MNDFSHIRFKDMRIEVWQEDVEDMQAVYSAADCFVFPSFAEGWGMPPREAALTGLAVIVTDYSGLAVGNEHWAFPLKTYQMVVADAAQNTYRHPDARWAQVDVDELAEQMRYIYEHPDESKAFGKEAAAWLAANQTWQHTAENLKVLIEEEHGFKSEAIG
jgi:glycosyltransferase involved in cell wall biosynthesis